jgi:hypothetical protein
MHEQTPRNLPWLDRLAVYIPGYGGYLDRGNRRAADRALRDAIARRLADARNRIEQAISACADRNSLGPIGGLEWLGQEGPRSQAKLSEEDEGRRPMLSEVSSLERVRSHIDRIAARLQSAGSGTDAFYSTRNLDAAKAESLHSADLALFELADSLVQRFDTSSGHDFLANLEADLNHFEQKLDERTNLLLGIK